MKRSSVGKALRHFICGAAGLLLVGIGTWAVSVLVGGFAYLIVWLMGGTVSFTFDLAASASLGVAVVVLFVVVSLATGEAIEERME